MVKDLIELTDRFREVRGQSPAAASVDDPFLSSLLKKISLGDPYKFRLDESILREAVGSNLYAKITPKNTPELRSSQASASTVSASNSATEMQDLRAALYSRDPEVHQAARERLKAMLQSPDRDVKQKALDFIKTELKQFKNDEFHSYHLIDQLKVLLAVVHELGPQGLGSVQFNQINSTIRALSTCNDPILLREILLHLAASQDQVGREAIIAYLRSAPADDSLASELVSALGNYKDSKTVKYLMALVADNKYGGAAIDALSKIGFEDPLLKKHLTELLKMSCSEFASPAGRVFRERLDEALHGPNSEMLMAQLREAAKKLPSPQQEKILAGLDVYKQAESLGIKPASRFGLDLLAELVKNRLENKPDGRPLAVLVCASADGSGALYGLSKPVHDLIAAGYRVVIHVTDNEDGVINAIQQSTAEQQAQVILFAGHGVAQSISYGAGDPAISGESHFGEAFLDICDLNMLQQAGVQNALANGGQVVSISCSTGMGGDQAANMWNMFSELFPQAAPNGIFCPSAPVGIGGISFDASGAINQVNWVIER